MNATWLSWLWSSLLSLQRRHTREANFRQRCNISHPPFDPQRGTVECAFWFLILRLLAAPYDCPRGNGVAQSNGSLLIPRSALRTKPTRRMSLYQGRTRPAACRSTGVRGDDVVAILEGPPHPRRSNGRRRRSSWWRRKPTEHPLPPPEIREIPWFIALNFLRQYRPRPGSPYCRQRGCRGHGFFLSALITGLQQSLINTLWAPTSHHPAPVDEAPSPAQRQPLGASVQPALSASSLSLNACECFCAWQMTRISRHSPWQQETPSRSAVR